VPRAQVEFQCRPAIKWVKSYRDIEVTVADTGNADSDVQVGPAGGPVAGLLLMAPVWMTALVPGTAAAAAAAALGPACRRGHALRAGHQQASAPAHASFPTPLQAAEGLIRQYIKEKAMQRVVAGRWGTACRPLLRGWLPVPMPRHAKQAASDTNSPHPHPHAAAPAGAWPTATWLWWIWR
jgi:hypothetical protein